jgi:hypothetical protein
MQMDADVEVLFEHLEPFFGYLAALDAHVRDRLYPRFAGMPPAELRKVRTLSELLQRTMCNVKRLNSSYPWEKEKDLCYRYAVEAERAYCVSLGLAIYTDDPEVLEAHTYIWQEATSMRARFSRSGRPFRTFGRCSPDALLEALILTGQHLRECPAPIRCVTETAHKIQFLWEYDHLTNSVGEIPRGQAYLDPLYQDPIQEMALSPYELSDEDLDAAAKVVGIKAQKRKDLILMKNGKLTSRSDFNRWRAGQRTIHNKRSKLAAVLEAAYRPRSITSRACWVSSASIASYLEFLGTGIRDGREVALFAWALQDVSEEDDGAAVERETHSKWFEATPPPIARTLRKTKYLFKKVAK